MNEQKQSLEEIKKRLQKRVGYSDIQLYEPANINCSTDDQCPESWQDGEDIIIKFILEEIQDKDEEWRGKVDKVICLLEKPDYQNPKAVRIARYLGKQETNHGAIAQARIDGYEVCLKEVKEQLLK